MGEVRLSRTWGQGPRSLCRQPCGALLTVQWCLAFGNTTSRHSWVQDQRLGHSWPRALPSVVTEIQTPWPNFPIGREPTLPPAQGLTEMGGARLEGFTEIQKPRRRHEPGKSHVLSVVQNTQALGEGSPRWRPCSCFQERDPFSGPEGGESPQGPPQVTPSGMGRGGPVPRDGGAGRGSLIWTLPWSKTLGQMSSLHSRLQGSRPLHSRCGHCSRWADCA